VQFLQFCLSKDSEQLSQSLLEELLLLFLDYNLPLIDLDLIDTCKQRELIDLLKIFAHPAQITGFHFLDNQTHFEFTDIILILCLLSTIDTPTSQIFD
jgi:hypothetical protein